MAERPEDERRNPAAEAAAVAIYSVLVLLLMLAWTDVPASRLEGHGASDTAKSKTPPIA